jgi:hypothetical protein
VGKCHEQACVTLYRVDMEDRTGTDFCEQCAADAMESGVFTDAAHGSEEPLFSVVEYSSHFAVRHNPSGDEHPMGDGVDTLFDADGVALVPGTPGFVEQWAASLNADAAETLAAYFPEHADC